MQPLPLIRLTFPEVRRALEGCDCRFTPLAEYGAMHDTDGVSTPALYMIEHGNGASVREAMLHVWDDAWIVPINDLRSVCAQLELELAIFDTMH